MAESPKKIAAIILAGKPKMESEDKEMESEEDTSMQESVGNEVLAAIKAKDPVALAQAIKSCMEC